MDVHSLISVHFIGIGGINMSAVAKLLLEKNVRVSGSDLMANEQTAALSARGASITLGESAEHLPADCQLVIYTSAAPDTNLERAEAKRRGLPELTNFQFLGQWTASQKTILVTGTHGKSTTTAMLGRVLIEAGKEPTVVVGSKVPDFADGNLRIGTSDLWIIEGDEYARHFLEFKPFGVVLNNIELDHTDVFPTIEIMVEAFRQLLGNISDGGLLVANVGSPQVAALLEQETTQLAVRKIRIIRFRSALPSGTGERRSPSPTDLPGSTEAESSWAVSSVYADNLNEVRVAQPGISYIFNLTVPGNFNALNSAGAALMARALGAEYPAIASSLATFSGIWRRFEKLGEKNGALIYTDYGHHPTAVRETLTAAHEMFPGRRVVLCFQPHHRNRTKQLFFDFEASFDQADVLILCEIYDVAGRDAKEDSRISSRDFLDVLPRRDAEQTRSRIIEYAADPTAAVRRTLELAQANDIVIVMGAGDIDGAIRKTMST